LSQPFLVRQLTVVTSGARHPYRFRAGINVISGPVGTGKSSLLELIRYALGGDATLTNAVIQAVQRVVLEAQLGSDNYRLERQIGDTTVQATNLRTGEQATYSVRHSKRYGRLSSFLLEALELPEARLVRSRTQPSASSSPLSFYDYYAYCYVPQAEIDRSVVHHLETVRENRRRSTFELLFGLSDQEILGLVVQVGELTDQLAQARAAEAAVARFLRSGDDPGEEALREQQRATQADLETARRRLQDLREDARSRTLNEGPLREQLSTTATRLQELESRASELQSESDERTRLAAQLDADLRKLDRARTAANILDSIAFVQCPRCLQPVERDGDRICYLCRQPEPPPPVDADVAYQGERRRVLALLDEVRGLVAASRQELEAVLRERSVVALGVTQLQARIDDRTRLYVSPLFEEIAAVGARVATIEARLNAIDHSLGHWSRHRGLAGDVHHIELEISRVNTEIAEAQAALNSRRQRVTEMSGLFDQIVRFLEPPWYGSPARIDARTYLPIVNDSRFETLSGGEKTIVNVAYHLALLSYAMRDGMMLLPYLLILDSPRKNVGFGRDDRGLVQRMYRRFGALHDLSLTSSRGDQYQLIIADNDPPSVSNVRFSHIRLDYSTPLIPDLQHPGPGNVETIGSATNDSNSN
jgi:DNA repair exonuclease SbcCD ATPase subunit